MLAMVIPNNATGRLSGLRPAITNPTDPNKFPNNRCHFLSCNRSEFHPQIAMLIAPAKNGIAVKNPV